MKKNLEALTEFHEFRHALVHLVLHQCLPLLRQSLLLVGDEITERR